LFVFHQPSTTEIYPLSLHDALPIFGTRDRRAEHVGLELHQQVVRRHSAVDTKLGEPETGILRHRLGDFRGLEGRGLERGASDMRSEEHTSELQSRENLVCRLLLEKK